MSSPVILPIFFANPSEVRGPVAIITIPSFAKDSISTISLRIISINSFFSNSQVTFLEKLSLSTAKACPAGTLVSSAILINNESNLLNSSFNKPHAFVSKFDLKELLHTISAKFSFECASEYFIGFISYNFTFIPFLAI